MHKVACLLFLCAGVVALSNCSGGIGGSGGNQPAPVACGTPPGVTQTVLVYPAPGATSVPDAFGQVIVRSTSAIPTNWGITVANIFGASANGNAFATAPSPLPTPNQTPTFANPVYQTSTFPNVSAAGQTLVVFLNNLSSNCTPNVSIGSFTTQ